MRLLEEATALERVERHYWSGAVHPAYRNMNGPFGGVTVATVLRAVLDDERRQGDPVALTVNLCTPMREGAFNIRTTLCRTGKTTQHWQMALSQRGETCVTASCVLGVRRPSWSFAPARTPAAPHWSSVAETSIPSDLPWIGQFAFRFVEGPPDLGPRPEGDIRSPRSLVWVSERPASRPDMLALAALSDIFFVRIVQVRGRMVPMGTVTLTTYFHQSAAQLAGLPAAPLLGVADAHLFGGNLADQTCELWSETGELLVSGVQVSWFKE
jgi:hypothetical protein